MTSTRTTPNDLFAAVASFFVPGLGQFLSGHGGRGVLIFGLGLGVWWMPYLLVGLHLAVTGANDPFSINEAHASMAPLAWGMRLIYHVGAAYDALTVQSVSTRRPPRRTSNPPVRAARPPRRVMRRRRRR